jgi:hypothetical protein
MSELTERWTDADSEYEVLVNLLIPAAQARLDRTHDDWDAMSSQAHGFLALDAAVIAGLVAAHDLIHRLWWLPTAGLIGAGVLFIASVWPREVALGPDLIDFHDEMREDSTLDALAGCLSALFLRKTPERCGWPHKQRLRQEGPWRDDARQKAP